MVARALLAAGAASLMALPSSTQAATITWGSPTTITGDANVSTNGASAAALNMGVTAPGTTTINGTFFAQGAPGTASSNYSTLLFNLSSSGNFGGSDTAFAATTGTANPWAGLSPAYQTLLKSATARDGTNVTNATPAAAPSITLTISGLTVGVQYEFEWWVDDSRNRPQDTFARVTTAAAGNSVTLDHNVTNTDGGLGQFAVGTFTADATNQVITFTGTANQAVVGTGASSTQINGFQLRAVPEPGAVGMIALGSVGLLARRRRYI